jgi:hypothetical protein
MLRGVKNARLRKTLGVTEPTRDDLPLEPEPAPPSDPYTPEPGPRAGERLAFRTLWWAVIVLFALIAVLIWVAVR